MAWRQLGGVLAAKGDFQTAEVDYKKALALQPKDSDAETGLAIVLISLNRTNEAISLLEGAVKDDPENLLGPNDAQFRPYPEFQSLNGYATEGISNYHAFQSQITRRFSRGLMFNFNYSRRIQRQT